MYAVLHRIIVVTYIALPILALLLALMSRKSREAAVVRLLMSAIAGIVLGIAICLVNAAASGGKVIITQALLAGYFATSLLLLLKYVDVGIRRSLERLFRIRRDRAEDVQWARAQWASASRVAILFLVGLPYVMAAGMTYRPKVRPVDDPKLQMGFNFQPVEFRATDGMRLSGWWIPALPPRQGGQINEQWGRRTVIVCHGLAANKANQLVMAQSLTPGGYNVLIFDFRAHGESGGQLTTFGDHETRDVLGAVKWVRENRAEESQRIFGVGASMGAAALICAAADTSAEGQAIEAVAVYGTYGSMRDLVRTIGHRYFLPPLDKLVRWIGIPLASAQVGSDLLEFAPADVVYKLWPRPILIIHGIEDEIIAFENGQALYRAATFPKKQHWQPEGDHNGIVSDQNLSDAVKEFFDTAQPTPII